MKHETSKPQTKPSSSIKRLKSRFHWRFAFRRSQTAVEQSPQFNPCRCHGQVAGCPNCSQFAPQVPAQAPTGAFSPSSLASPWDGKFINPNPISSHDSQPDVSIHMQGIEHRISGDNGDGTPFQALNQSTEPKARAPSQRTSSGSSVPPQGPYPSPSAASSTESFGRPESSQGVRLRPRSLSPSDERFPGLRSSSSLGSWGSQSLLTIPDGDELALSAYLMRAEIIYILKIVTSHIYPEIGPESMDIAIQCWVEAQQAMESLPSLVTQPTQNYLRRMLIDVGANWRYQTAIAIQKAVHSSFNLERFHEGEARKNAAKALAKEGTFFYATVNLTATGNLLDFVDPTTKTKLVPMSDPFEHPCLMLAFKQLMYRSARSFLGFPREVFDPVPVRVIAFIATIIKALLDNIGDSDNGNPSGYSFIVSNYEDVYEYFVAEYTSPEHAMPGSVFQRKLSSLYAGLSGYVEVPDVPLTESQKVALEALILAMFNTSSGSGGPSVAAA